jgi:two-component system sensor histidine kinase KdpD
VIRRAATLARRSGAELVGVHVDDGRQPPGARSAVLASHRTLLGSLGGRFEQLVAGDVAGALVDFARSAQATQVVLGAGGESRWVRLLRGSVVDEVLGRAGGIDVHVVGPQVRHPSLPAGRTISRLPPRRRRVGWMLAIGGTAAMTAVLVVARGMVGHGGHFPLYLLVVVLAALGGTGPAVTAAVLASFALNWFFTPPLHTWIIDDGENVLALAAFLVVGVLVGFLVTSLARSSDDARRGRSEAEALARIASEMVGLDDPLPAMLERIRLALQLQGMAVVGHDGHLVATAGTEPTSSDPSRTLGTGILRLRGELAPGDERVLDAFLSQLSATMERQALRRDAAQLEAVGAADRLRTALLRAVSHDLRTPLASIKASVTSLLQQDVAWTPAAQHEFLDTIDEEVDRLDAVVGNLLDASRLEAGVIEPGVQHVALDEVVQSALASISGLDAEVVVDVPVELPTVRADRGLLERAIANLVANAAHASPASVPVEISAAAVGSAVRLRVIDRGPGIPEDQREVIFRPFQRLGDGSASGGVGLGLAVARGVVEAMGGDVAVEETAGGGTTMCVTLPRGDRA